MRKRDLLFIIIGLLTLALGTVCLLILLELSPGLVQWNIQPNSIK